MRYPPPRVLRGTPAVLPLLRTSRGGVPAAKARLCSLHTHTRCMMVFDARVSCLRSGRLASPRRCASDLAAGGCEGTSGGDTIVRCDLCKAWFHISCGQMAIGDGMSTEDSKDETICRTCARISIGVMQGKDPSVAVQRQLALIRERSKTMLAFLEEESRAGAGPLEGVIDLNVSPAEPPAGRPAVCFCFLLCGCQRLGRVGVCFRRQPRLRTFG